MVCIGLDGLKTIGVKLKNTSKSIRTSSDTLILTIKSNFFVIVWLLQIAFYFLALIDWLLKRIGISFKILSLSLYFVFSNATVVIAFYKFLRGERFAA
ncbi:MAG: hypothetical protein WKF71_05805 [Pyrinomonadaceae bacterium]|jgi:hypothetical protein